MRPASTPSISRANDSSSRALLMPIFFGSVQRMPVSGSSPMRMKAAQKRALAAATRWSVATARDSPAPNAEPSTAATTGLGPASISRTTWQDSSRISRLCSTVRLVISEISAPALNCPPAPVSTMARDSTSATMS
ncbi:hypothetical protein D3C84_496570 [compost metagenome]